MKILSVVTVAILVICQMASCLKKDNSTPEPNPTPTVKPDTLSAGWVKINVTGQGILY